MAVFAVFEHPEKDPDRTIFVKEGFSSAALVFTVLWALWHRMWVVSAILIAVFGLIYVLVRLLGLNEINAALLELAVSLSFGFEARNLWAYSLRRSGYRAAALVMAANLEEAELKFVFAQRSQNHSPVPSSKMRSEPADTLGLFETA